MAILRLSVRRGGRTEDVIIDESNNQLDAESVGITWDTAKLSSLDNLAGIIEAIKGRIIQSPDRGSVAQSRFIAAEGASFGQVTREDSYDAPTFTALTGIAGVEFKAASYTTAMHLIDDINTIMGWLATHGFTPDVTAPTVTITSPTSAATYVTADSTVDIAGTSSDAGDVANLVFEVDTGDSGACTGTTSWSASAVELDAGDNEITVTAYDKNSNTGTDVLTVTRDNTDPVCTITSPTAAATHDNLADETLDLGGTATDNVEVDTVTWVCDTGGSGSATTFVAPDWTITNIDLDPGENVVTVTATDTAGNTHADIITVTYTP